MLPIFATGEPKKQYYFWWVLQPRGLSALKDFAKNPAWSSLASTVLTFFKDTVAPIYVSQLAKKIDFPPEKVETDTISVGPLKIPYPVRVPLEPIKVTYVEDELNTVFLWHRKWQQMIWANTKESIGLKTIDMCCFSAQYIPTAAIPSNFIPSVTTTSGDSNMKLEPIDTLLPVGLEIFPKLFPIDINRDSVDKAATGFATTTVTYIRVPEISSPGTGLVGVSKVTSKFGF